MFRELNAKHGNERLGKLQNLRTILRFAKKGLKSHNVKRLWAKEEIKGIFVEFLED